MRDAQGNTRRRWLTDQQMRDASALPTLDEIFAADDFSRREGLAADRSDRWVELALALCAGVLIGLTAHPDAVADGGARPIYLQGECFTTTTERTEDGQN